MWGEILPILVGVAVVAAALTAAMTASLHSVTRRLRPVMSAVVAGLIVPVAGTTLLLLLRGRDLHGFILVAAILFAVTSLPVSLATSAATVWRMRPNGRERARPT